jgi:hypothetical protein
MFHQENAVEDKTNVAAKSHELNCSGQLVSTVNLHTTVSNQWAMSSFCSRPA